MKEFELTAETVFGRSGTWFESSALENVCVFVTFGHMFVSLLVARTFFSILSNFQKSVLS